MGFPSLAQDYIQLRLSLNTVFIPNNTVFIPNPATTFRVDIPDGFLLVDSAAAVKPGQGCVSVERLLRAGEYVSQ